ncbi:phage filamentation protein Fil family protein [Mixta calida]|uniref:phage filamentation protein Fil family protein n=1 Tax=Mixta calida TaxID=665913 RepID=UPI00403B296C
MAFSVAPLLKQQSPSPSYGHGWIIGQDGKRWHPSNNQAELLAGLTGNGRKKKWQLKVKSLLFS